MLAAVASHAPIGIDGEIVSVEVDLRPGIPGIDLVGLPDSAVRESRERVRVAIRNSGFSFPRKRILVNLAPAGLRKVGASFDLPIALGILGAAGHVPLEIGTRLMVLGELNLAGLVRPVNGVLSAVGTGLQHGIEDFLVPRDNRVEAQTMGRGRIRGITSLADAASCLAALKRGAPVDWNEPPVVQAESPEKIFGDVVDIMGHEDLKRALEIAAAGRHNLFLFGPPGSGKTMAATRLPSLLPPLAREEALTATRIHSIAGLLPSDTGLIQHRPFRMPHHTASLEGLIGGGKWIRPGEVSLAHEGILFLDEAPEFKHHILQSLREPAEQGWVTIARAERNVRFPASFQLVLASNSCPCGNLGHDDRTCLCGREDVQRYWRRMGNALLDRMDIRVAVQPVPMHAIIGKRGDSSRDIRGRVVRAAKRQRKRYEGRDFTWNGRLPPGSIMQFCPLSSQCSGALQAAVKRMSLSSRACHSVLKLARTIADLAGSADILEDHLAEALHLRRFGENDTFWSCR